MKKLFSIVCLTVILGGLVSCVDDPAEEIYPDLTAVEANDGNNSNGPKDPPPPPPEGN
jgi:hypothetical protein